MKVIHTSGEEILAIELSADASGILNAHMGVKGNAIELDMPKAEISFENTQQGLILHTGLAGVEGSIDVLVEYDDIKALRSIPGKGLVSFALKAFR